MANGILKMNGRLKKTKRKMQIFDYFITGVSYTKM